MASQRAGLTRYPPPESPITIPPLPTTAFSPAVSYFFSSNTCLSTSARYGSCAPMLPYARSLSGSCVSVSSKTSSKFLKSPIFVVVEPGLITKMSVFSINSISFCCKTLYYSTYSPIKAPTLLFEPITQRISPFEISIFASGIIIGYPSF